MLICIGEAGPVKLCPTEGDRFKDNFKNKFKDSFKDWGRPRPKPPIGTRDDRQQ